MITWQLYECTKVQSSVPTMQQAFFFRIILLDLFDRSVAYNVVRNLLRYPRLWYLLYYIKKVLGLRNIYLTAFRFRTFDFVGRCAHPLHVETPRAYEHHYPMLMECSSVLAAPILDLPYRIRNSYSARGTVERNREDEWGRERERSANDTVTRLGL